MSTPETKTEFVLQAIHELSVVHTSGRSAMTQDSLSLWKQKRRSQSQSHTCKICGMTIENGDMTRPISMPEYSKRKWVHGTCAWTWHLHQAGCFNRSGIEEAVNLGLNAYHSHTLKTGPGALPQCAANEPEPVTAMPQVEPAVEPAVEPIDATPKPVKRDWANNPASIGEALQDLASIGPAIAELQEAVETIKTNGGGHATPSIVVVDRQERFVASLPNQLAHASLQTVMDLVTARQHVLLSGPTGCGKTHLAKQVADVLGLSFSCQSVSAGITEGQLLGKYLPTSSDGSWGYIPATFATAYENGGVMLLDEIDAADPNTLLAINAALANGHLTIPSRHEQPVAKRHDDFICIAAANTWLLGADLSYVGREQLDLATVDRFFGRVSMGYDVDIEAALCPDEETLCKLHGMRANLIKHRIRRVVSTRTIASAYVMRKQHDWPTAKIVAMITVDWTADEKSKVLS